MEKTPSCFLIVHNARGYTALPEGYARVPREHAAVSVGYATVLRVACSYNYNLEYVKNSRKVDVSNLECVRRRYSPTIRPMRWGLCAAPKNPPAQELIFWCFQPYAAGYAPT